MLRSSTKLRSAARQLRSYLRGFAVNLNRNRATRKQVHQTQARISYVRARQSSFARSFTIGCLPLRKTERALLRFYVYMQFK